MIIGVVKEIKTNENRVALMPAGAEILATHQHPVVVEKNAGMGSGITDAAYRAAGAEIVDSPAEVYIKADLILKVKDPLAQEYRFVRPGQIILAYFHFAASRTLTEAMIKSRAICIGYETVERADHSLPLLIPMSEVAGRMAVQEGAKYLEKTFGGRGILLGGIPGVKPANVLILGGGVVGTNAAKMAAGLGARVTLIEINLDRLRYLDDIMPHNVTTLVSSPQTIRDAIVDADLVIGAVLIPGGKAPRLISREMLKTMKPGAVLVDVAVDQGGCIESIRSTTHQDPTYVVEGIIHYGVENMPSAVPLTSTTGLTNATLPYILAIADHGLVKTVREYPEIAVGVNVAEGRVTHHRVAEAFSLPLTPLDHILR